MSDDPTVVLIPTKSSAQMTEELNRLSDGLNSIPATKGDIARLYASVTTLHDAVLAIYHYTAVPAEKRTAYMEQANRNMQRSTDQMLVGIRALFATATDPTDE